MSYVVLARKWRPVHFADLVGQEHVATTLENAIASGRLAHAFLFTGVRGVGKTTSARLLARSLNCLGDPDTQTPGVDPGPTARPCLKCAACREITAGSDVDVREIDGASYNGVDEVRKLQESIPYRPSRDRYKVFIIDEVHMLTASAWNAFLKTLEEPPPHVKFIFATTEVHKVPVTILSRVQRFDFKLISARQIIQRLRQVLDGEHISAEEAALSIIARQAAGSMRDAMSLLDQVIAWNDSRLDGESVARVLGVASRRVLYELLAALLEGNAAGCLHIMDGICQQGFDIPHVARDILALLRDLVVGRVCPDADQLLDLPLEEKKDVVRLAETANLDDLLRLHHGFSAGFDEVVRSGQPRAALEMLLVRLARRPPLLPIDDLLGRLAGLERRLAQGGGSSTSGGAPRAARPVSEGDPFAAPSGAAHSSGRPQIPAPSRPRTERTEGTPPAGNLDPGSLRDSGAPAGHAAVIPISGSRRPKPGTGRPGTTRLGHPARDSLVPPAANADDHPEEVPQSEPELLAEWQELVESIARERPEVGAVLEHAVLLSSDPRLLELGWPKDSVFRAQFPESALADLIRCADAERRNQKPRLVSILDDDPRAAGRQTLAERETAERARRYRARVQEIRNHASVRDVIDVLGGRLRDVRVKG